MQLSPDKDPKYSLNIHRPQNSIYLTTHLPELISLAKLNPCNITCGPYLNPIHTE